ncbi:MAG: M24 family metallopeptidase, partial [Oscillospiraceae bacterium]|nr:M24 family metallopeptidase [Oscillospiraceae bacterium]
ALNSRGVKDVRLVGDDVLGGAIKILGEKGISSGRVGYCPEVTPAGWPGALRSAFPGLELVDVTEDIYALRTVKSDEEISAARAGAAAADKAYERLCSFGSPGVSEMELAAELEYTMKKAGAEETYIALSSGRFGAEEDFPSSTHGASESGRSLREGDCVSVEMSPRWQGYWTQLVRTVCLGKPSEELRAAHEVCLYALKAAAAALKPGAAVKDIRDILCRAIKEKGFEPVLPLGQVCGVDLFEEPLSAESGLRLTAGMTLVIRPAVMRKSGSVFHWGETFLVTASGGESLAGCGNELRSVFSKGGDAKC